AVVVYEVETATFRLVNYALRLNAAGAKVGAPLLLRNELLGLTGTPTAVPLNNGGFLVLWDDDGFMKGKAFSAAGARTGTFAFEFADGQGDFNPVAVALPDGRVLIVIPRHFIDNGRVRHSPLLASLLAAGGTRTVGPVNLSRLRPLDPVHVHSL